MTDQCFTCDETTGEEDSLFSLAFGLVRLVMVLIALAWAGETVARAVGALPPPGPEAIALLACADADQRSC